VSANEIEEISDASESGDRIAARRAPRGRTIWHGASFDATEYANRPTRGSAVSARPSWIAVGNDDEICSSTRTPERRRSSGITELRRSPQPDGTLLHRCRPAASAARAHRL